VFVQQFQSNNASTCFCMTIQSNLSLGLVTNACGIHIITLLISEAGGEEAVAIIPTFESDIMAAVPSAAGASAAAVPADSMKVLVTGAAGQIAYRCVPPMRLSGTFAQFLGCTLAPCLTPLCMRHRSTQSYLHDRSRRHVWAGPKSCSAPS